MNFRNCSTYIKIPPGVPNSLVRCSVADLCNNSTKNVKTAAKVITSTRSANRLESSTTGTNGLLIESTQSTSTNDFTTTLINPTSGPTTIVESTTSQRASEQYPTTTTETAQSVITTVNPTAMFYENAKQDKTTEFANKNIELISNTQPATTQQTVIMQSANRATTGSGKKLNYDF